MYENTNISPLKDSRMSFVLHITNNKHSQILINIFVHKKNFFCDISMINYKKSFKMHIFYF